MGLLGGVGVQHALGRRLHRHGPHGRLEGAAATAAALLIVVSSPLLLLLLLLWLVLLLLLLILLRLLLLGRHHHAPRAHMPCPSQGPTVATAAIPPTPSQAEQQRQLAAVRDDDVTAVRLRRHHLATHAAATRGPPGPHGSLGGAAHRDHISYRRGGLRRWGRPLLLLPPLLLLAGAAAAGGGGPGGPCAGGGLRRERTRRLGLLLLLLSIPLLLLLPSLLLLGLCQEELLQLLLEPLLLQ